LQGVAVSVGGGDPVRGLDLVQQAHYLAIVIGAEARIADRLGRVALGGGVGEDDDGVHIAGLVGDTRRLRRRARMH
jgi:hypothetical protein